ncbi:MAG: hypothetical protein JWN02_603 [Acidobacteria bacterium]|nr:hypothetical protein [Acidobacteriota bacterium]
MTATGHGAGRSRSAPDGRSFATRLPEAALSNEKQPEKKEIKVTDRRIFTPEGDLREEFRGQIKPSDNPMATPPPPAEPPQSAATPPSKAAEERSEKPAAAKPQPQQGEPRRKPGESATPPETRFADFLQQLIVQAYMSLGLMRHPSQPQPRIEPEAAKEMIDILQMLQEKTAGNLTPEEEEFLGTHLGELKLAYVQRTKRI